MADSNQQLEWHDTSCGRHFFAVEQAHSQRALRQISGPSVLQLGNLLDEQSVLELDFPQLVRVGNCLEQNQENYDLAADAAFLPFADDCFASVLLPHVLESHELPHQVLREVHRVLQPEGHLLLASFNPYSLIGAQRALHLSAAYKGEYYSLHRVKDWLNLLGFEVVGSSMYHYAPLCKSAYMTNKLRALNYIGDRWLPMTGGSYLLSARKRELGGRLVGKLRFSKHKRRSGLAPAPAGRTTAGRTSAGRTNQSK